MEIERLLKLPENRKSKKQRAAMKRKQINTKNTEAFTLCG